jgi:hypothetical protein
MTSLFPRDGTSTADNDRRMMIDFEDTPDGKKWECCPTCNGKGKVLTDEIKREESVPLSITGSDGNKRYFS